MSDYRPHYYKAANGMTPFDVIDAWGLDFYEGNALKYLLRWRKKDGLADLRKAATYIREIIARAELDDVVDATIEDGEEWSGTAWRGWHDVGATTDPPVSMGDPAGLSPEAVRLDQDDDNHDDQHDERGDEDSPKIQHGAHDTPILDAIARIARNLAQSAPGGLPLPLFGPVPPRREDDAQGHHGRDDTYRERHHDEPRGDVSAESLLDEALRIRMYGEYAPGGTENWKDWDARAGHFMRTCGPVIAYRMGGDIFDPADVEIIRREP